MNISKLTLEQKLQGVILLIITCVAFINYVL